MMVCNGNNPGYFIASSYQLEQCNNVADVVQEVDETQGTQAISNTSTATSCDYGNNSKVNPITQVFLDAAIKGALQDIELGLNIERNTQMIKTYSNILNESSFEVLNA